MPRGRGGHGFGAGRAGTLVEFSGVAPAVAGVEEEDRERQVRLAGAEAWLGPDRVGRVANLGSKECEGALGRHGATDLLPKCVSTCRVTPTQRRSLGR